MHKETLLPHIFRNEFSKIVSVLSRTFGLEHIETAEDITSDTFLIAAETWGKKGIPDNPTAWIYAVAKNRTKDYLRRNQLFSKKISTEIKNTQESHEELQIDLSEENITDSQLQMMFAVCHPAIPPEAQVGLSLRILCGFGIEEIASAFLSNKETINKRLLRAKAKLKTENIKMQLPPANEIDNRLDNVLTTLYLLFNEGYYSQSTDFVLKKDCCIEAMRLVLMLLSNKMTNKPQVNALLSLMCFHASRFEARTNKNGESVLYEQQEDDLWDKELIQRGEIYLSKASEGGKISRYHLEAAIAFWHTVKKDSQEKWENILQLYNRLLQIEYSPVAALNRTYALSKAVDPLTAIKEAEKLAMQDSHLYFSLLGELYSTIDKLVSIRHFESALKLAKNISDQKVIKEKIRKVNS